MIKVSIIVPIYNASFFLSECIESILSQTYSNFEILLINDGSDDDSGKICDYYASLDQRINVVHQANSGRSSARNVGIGLAKGEYIYFADSDDVLDSDLLKKALDVFEKHDVDSVRFGYNKFDSNGLLYRRTLDEKLYVFNNDDLKIKYAQSLLKGEVYFQVWSGVYKTSIIRDNKLRFANSDDVFSEDSLFSVLFCLYSNSSYSLPFQLYNYRNVSTSIMNVTRSKKTILINNFVNWSKTLEKSCPSDFLKKNTYLISHYIYLIAIPHRVEEKAATIKVVKSVTDKLYFCAQSRLFYLKTKQRNKKEYGFLEGFKQNTFNCYFSDLNTLKFNLKISLYRLISLFRKNR